jgi:hypothetical protein
MMRTVLTIASAIVTLLAISHSSAAQPRSPEDALKSVLSLNTVTNGVAKTRDGRIFLLLSRIDGSDGPRVVEWMDGKPRPYPEGIWNDWTAGKVVATGFVGVNALRIGPDGDLWIVDVGAPGIDNEIDLAASGNDIRLKATPLTGFQNDSVQREAFLEQDVREISNRM